MVSQRLKKHVNDLVYLQKARPCIRNHLTNKADRSLLDCLCECADNNLRGNVPLTKLQKEKLKRNKAGLGALTKNSSSYPRCPWLSRVVPLEVLGSLGSGGIYLLRLVPSLKQCREQRCYNRCNRYPEIKNLHLSRCGTESVCRVKKRMLHPVSCHSCIRRWGNNMVSQRLKMHGSAM
jgi:hypothetical protein